jgi:hypothetical protein
MFVVAAVDAARTSAARGPAYQGCSDRNGRTVGGLCCLQAVALAHDPEVLAAFQDGETRLLYARHKADLNAPPYYLEDGTATQVRSWAKEHLECFLPDCTDRRLTTVARAGKRDGFKHLPGAGGHSREGVFHQQAKALIARWAAALHPGVQAVAEQTTRSRQRRADVLLTWPDGRQVAVEVQYAGLSVDAWQARHASYQEQGVLDVWLLGHLRPQLRPARRWSHEPEGAAAGKVDLGPLQQAIVAAGVPLLWINPVQERIGTAWTVEEPDWFEYAAPDRWDDLRLPVPPVVNEYGTRALFGAVNLAACHVDRDGLHMPIARALANNAARLADIDDQRRRSHRVRKADAERRARERAEREKCRQTEEAARRVRQEAHRVEHQRWWRDQQLAWQHDWLASGLRAKVLARYGTIPSVIAETSVPAEGVHAYPEHWHAVLYGELLLGCKQGDRLGVGDAYKALLAAGIQLAPDDPGLVFRTIVAYLQHLERHEHVHLQHKRGSPRIDAVIVVGGVETVHALREECARLHREHEAAEQQRRREEVQRRQRERDEADARWRTELERQRQQRTGRAQSENGGATSGPAGPTAKGRTALRCVRCRLPLDPMLADVGRHFGC